MDDITETNLLNRDIVYVVGPGPNGVAAYNKIPKDSMVIACNMAIMAPIPTKIWICEDSSIPTKNWFKTSLNRNDVVRVFSDSISKIAHSDYGFYHRGIWKRGEDPEYIKGETFGGASVSCRAVQFAAMSGASKIALVGVDMSGMKYFDGSMNKMHRDGGIWDVAQAFDEIIRWLARNTPSKIYTLTETMLREPMSF